MFSAYLGKVARGLCENAVEHWQAVLAPGPTLSPFTEPHAIRHHSLRRRLDMDADGGDFSANEVRSREPDIFALHCTQRGQIGVHEASIHKGTLYIMPLSKADFRCQLAVEDRVLLGSSLAKHENRIGQSTNSQMQLNGSGAMTGWMAWLESDTCIPVGVTGCIHLQPEDVSTSIDLTVVII